VIRATALALLAATPAWAETQVVTTRYACDRGVEVPGTYVTADDLAVVVLNVDGTQITLYQEPAASGVRYGWPSDGATYVWWTKGKDATLFWKEAGTETPLLTCADTQ
jgi:membrane-bound inhibitor of C-type lysozyme